MTPAERARQIDKEEFAAECTAARQRAVLYVAQRKHAARCAITNWLGRDAPPDAFNGSARRGRVYRPPKMHEAFGQSQSLSQWEKDSGIAIGTIRSRLKAGWHLEDALTRTVQEHRTPGVVSNLPASLGTGGGRSAQESPEITFSEMDEIA